MARSATIGVAPHGPEKVGAMKIVQRDLGKCMAEGLLSTQAAVAVVAAALWIYEHKGSYLEDRDQSVWDSFQAQFGTYAGEGLEQGMDEVAK